MDKSKDKPKAASWNFDKDRAEKFAQGVKRRGEKKHFANAYSALKDLVKGPKDRSKDPS